MKNLPILTAVFLVISMTVQFYVSYQWEKRQVLEHIDYEMQLAHKDFIFKMHDIQDAGEEMQAFLSRFLDNPDVIMRQPRIVLRRYPDILACYVSFRPGFFHKEDYWYCPCAWRNGDSIVMEMYGDLRRDYFQSKWYKGALDSDNGRYWSPSYRDEDFSEPIGTHSVRVDQNGELVCVVGFDFSMKWVDAMLEEIKPYEDAFCLLYSSDGTLMQSSNNMENRTGIGEDMIVQSSELMPLGIVLEIAVPKKHVWEAVRFKSLITLSILLLGILMAGILIRRLWRDQNEYSRVETENQILEHELRIASNIQRGILREGERGKVKDKWPDVELEAGLVPMKEVGGDLYDYFRKDNDLYFIIGDVSGKSVTAAMFMSATVNLFRSAVRRLCSPKAIMEEMNGVLSDNNPTMMFVTAFVGRLHIPTGQLLYCNAGHCEPLVVKGTSGKAEPIGVKPNIPLGYDGQFRFSEQGMILVQDDVLVLYTDGITEARNELHEMLGKQRWIEIVENNIHALRNGNMAAIDEVGMRFIGNAEQSDDITLMTIRKITENEPVRIRVENKIEQWPILKSALHQSGLCFGLEMRELVRIEVAVEEAVVNIVNYSQATEITLSCNRQSSEICIQLIDNGIPFDPTSQALTDIHTAVANRQIGGMGITLLRKMVDEVYYTREKDKNILTLTKKYTS